MFRKVLKKYEKSGTYYRKIKKEKQKYETYLRKLYSDAREPTIEKSLTRDSRTTTSGLFFL